MGQWIASHTVEKSLVGQLTTDDQYKEPMVDTEIIKLGRWIASHAVEKSQRNSSGSVHYTAVVIG